MSSTYQPKSLIRVSEFRLSGNEHKYTLDCLASRWLTQGKYVRQLEERFAELAGVRYALACSSGTSALHLAVLAAGITSVGEPVAVPALTYIATVNAVAYCDSNPRPYFVDADPESWTFARLKQAYRTRLAIATDLYDAISSCPQSYTIILDAAHIDPLTYKSNGPKSADIACFSFFASKVIACGEGGMLVTDNEEYYNRARLYRGQGATTPSEYHHGVIGYNYRMTNLQAGIALAQLEDLPNTLTYRRHLIDRYRANLAGSAITLQGGERASGWMMAVLVPEPTGFDTHGSLGSIANAVKYTNPASSVRERLLAANIETRPFFVPVCDTQAYAFMNQQGSCPVAANLYSRGVCLPTHLGLDDEDVDYICERLLEEVKPK